MKTRILLASFVLIALGGISQAQLLISSTNNATAINFSTAITGVMGSNYTGNGFDDPVTTGRLDRGTWAARVGTDYLTYNPNNSSNSTSQIGFNSPNNQTIGSIARGNNTTAGLTSGMQASELSASSNATIASYGRIFSYRTATNVQGAIFLRVQNNTGSSISQWNLGYTGFFIDITSVATDVTAAYSLDGGASFTTLTGIGFTSPGTGSVTSPTVDSWTLASINSGNPLSFNASVANGSEMVLRWTFAGATNAESNRVGIDNISITAIPEPTTWALLAAGLTTLVVFRRRRRN